MLFVKTMSICTYSNTKADNKQGSSERASDRDKDREIERIGDKVTHEGFKKQETISCVSHH